MEDEILERDEILDRLHRIYNEVTEIYGKENCYLTGSMAVYLLGKQLGIDVSGVNPNDVDIIVDTAELLPNPNKDEPRQRTMTYNKGTINEYDLIKIYTKNKGIYHIKVKSTLGDETLDINVQTPKKIKDEYMEQKEDKTDESKVLKNIEILTQIIRSNKFEEIPPKHHRRKIGGGKKLKF